MATVYPPAKEVAAKPCSQHGLAIPLLDLALGELEAAKIVKEACEEAGFFYICNHGVPQQLVQQMFQQLRALFDLPMDEKLKLLQDKNNRGYTAFEEEVLDPEQQQPAGRGDTKEGYYVGVEIPDDHPRARFPLHGPNVWPRPDLLPDFRPVSERYFQACHALSMRIVRIMAVALGLSPDFFHQPGRFDHAVATLRLLHYSGEPSRPEEGVFGCGAHSDYGMLTVLAVDGPGLQICRSPRDAPRQQQVWEDVGVVEGAFVVNIGDMLERWTNGRWRSTLHRVVIPPPTAAAAASSGGARGEPSDGSQTGEEARVEARGTSALQSGDRRDRYSIPFFFEPNFDCLVECLPCCTSPNDPPRWPPTLAGEHLLNMYKKTHLAFDAMAKLH